MLQPVAGTLQAHAPTSAGVEFDKLGIGAVALAHNLTRASHGELFRSRRPSSPLRDGASIGTGPLSSRRDSPSFGHVCVLNRLVYAK